MNVAVLRRLLRLPLDPSPQLIENTAQATMKLITTLLMAAVALPLAMGHKNATAKERLPNLKLPCVCDPPQCPTFLPAETVGGDAKADEKQLTLMISYQQICQCENAAAQGCYIKANGGMETKCLIGSLKQR